MLEIDYEDKDNSINNQYNPKTSNNNYTLNNNSLENNINNFNSPNNLNNPTNNQNNIFYNQQTCQNNNYTSTIIFDEFYNYLKYKTASKSNTCPVILTKSLFPKLMESSLSDIYSFVKNIMFYILPILTFILIIILVVRCKNEKNTKYTKFQDSDFYLSNVNLGRIVKPFKYINLNNEIPETNNVIEL